MPSKDFTSNQIRVTKLIASGGLSGGGAQAGNNIGIAVYSASNASDIAGGITDTSMLDQVGKDVFMFISGSTEPNGRGKASGAITLIGGDLHVSGTVTSNSDITGQNLGQAAGVTFFSPDGGDTGTHKADRNYFRISAPSQNSGINPGGSEEGNKRTIGMGASGVTGVRARILEILEPAGSSINQSKSANQYGITISGFDNSSLLGAFAAEKTGSCGIGFSRSAGISMGASIKAEGDGDYGKMNLHLGTRKTYNDPSAAYYQPNGDGIFTRLHVSSSGLVTVPGPFNDSTYPYSNPVEGQFTYKIGNGNPKGQGMFRVGNVGSGQGINFDQQTIQAVDQSGATSDFGLMDLYLNPSGSHVIIGASGDSVTHNYLKVRSRLGVGNLVEESTVIPHTFLVKSNNDDAPVATFHNDGNDFNRVGIEIMAGLDAPTGTGNGCIWVMLKDGNETAQSMIRYKNTGDKAEFSAASDERVKTDIKDSTVDSLYRLSQLNLKSFRVIYPTKAPENRLGPLEEIGFIAQDVEKQFPEFVAEGPWDGWDFPVKQMGQSGFIPHLVKAIQQLKQENDALKARIEALES